MTNPLYRNDSPGEFPDSWYAATTDIPPPRPSLRGTHKADVCIVGAGYTGLTAALHLARKGLRVIVLDAHRAGFGASGRNGGMVCSGYNWMQKDLAAKLGHDTARALWDLAEDAKSDLRDLAARHASDSRYTPGAVYGACKAGDLPALHEEVAYVQDHYAYNAITPLDRTGIRDIVRTESYAGGTLDMGAGHIHPLRYAVGLAQAAVSAGAVIFEQSEVHHIAPGTPAKVRTGRGHVAADHVILAGNGYLPGLNRTVAAKVMPINSFMCATEPLGDRAASVLARDVAVADTKFVVNYFRLSQDNRLLFGGRESYSLGYPSDIKTALVARMEGLFPQIKGVGIDHVWGGTLGITATRLPSVQRVAPNVIAAGGFSGHGVALSGMAGRVMAEAVMGQAGRFDVMSQLPVPSFPGGAAFRAPVLTLAMTWYALRDRLGV